MWLRELTYSNIYAAVCCILMASPSDPARGQTCLKVVCFTELPSENTEIGITEESDVCTTHIEKAVHKCRLFPGYVPRAASNSLLSA
jgi:hypothetical protein